MREIVAFILIQLLVLSSAFLVADKPYLEEYRPDIISENPTAWDAVQIIGYVLIITVVLLALKIFGLLRLRYFIDVSILVAAYFYAVLLTNRFIPSLAFALLVLALRQANNLLLFNATSSIAIGSCSLLFGLFIPPDILLLLLAGMSVYDVIGVLYTKHIKYIWIDDSIIPASSNAPAAATTTCQGNKVSNATTAKITDAKIGVQSRPSPPQQHHHSPPATLAKCSVAKSWRNTLALIFPQGMHSTIAVVGSGDFAMPALLTVSMTAAGGILAGLVCLVLSSVGFMVLQVFTEQAPQARKTGIPGIPILALFCTIAVLLSRLFGILPIPI